MAATTVGASTGIGGGVIIKPALDFMNIFSLSEINILSSVSVFTMSISSLINQIHMKTKINCFIAFPLGLGATVGGFAGQHFINLISNIFISEHIISIIQNILLALILTISICFTLKKEKIITKESSGIVISFVLGFFMGTIASFLGIGGGPINIILIMYFFSFDIKQSAVLSIITIFFSHLVKLITITVSGGFRGQELNIIPLIMLGAVLGGLIGSALNKKLSEKTISYLYIIMQVIIIILSLFNGLIRIVII